MFGMGTGGSSLLSSPDRWFEVIPSKLNNVFSVELLSLFLYSFTNRVLAITLASVSLSFSNYFAFGKHTLRIVLLRNTTVSCSRFCFAKRCRQLAFRVWSLFFFEKQLWSSPRAISTGQLHTLLHFHLRPINLVVFQDPY